MAPAVPPFLLFQNLQNVSANPTFTTRGARISAGAR